MLKLREKMKTSGRDTRTGRSKNRPAMMWVPDLSLNILRFKRQQLNWLKSSLFLDTET